MTGSSTADVPAPALGTRTRVPKCGSITRTRSRLEDLQNQTGSLQAAIDDARASADDVKRQVEEAQDALGRASSGKRVTWGDVAGMVKNMTSILKQFHEGHDVAGTLQSLQESINDINVALQGKASTESVARKISNIELYRTGKSVHSSSGSYDSPPCSSINFSGSRPDEFLLIGGSCDNTHGGDGDGLTTMRFTPPGDQEGRVPSNSAWTCVSPNGQSWSQGTCMAIWRN
eukprot:TRINITY_DN37707_c0_g1_i1.p1 TRINITY_DN37707_c0_g1~~TRINITY_DN37707_c0_g1_i1.p1  ORF type:complete len:256 (-),score=5.04 TRINITY_DN37707_c0_g1_i1:120-812(-)